MVISKVGKRKRNPPPVKETRTVQQEQPKRPKVQAQRKFAQVCGGSASSTLPSSLLANPSAQNGSAKTETINHDPPQELLPNRRPNTEDFLTFLCFRGTSVLPSHLDFFNTNKNKNVEQQQQQQQQQQPSQQQMKPKNEPTAPSCSSKELKLDEKRTASNNKNDSASSAIGAGGTAADTTTTKKETDQPNFIPFAVRKRADTVATGSRKQTVQALKKKYQDQRIAKNKAQCKTRSSAAKEESETCKMPKSKQNDTADAAKNTTAAAAAAVNNSTGKGQNKRKLRGTMGTSQIEDDDVAVTGKSPKIVKESNKESGKETKKEVNKEVNKETNKDSAQEKTQKNSNETNKGRKITTRTTKSVGSIPAKSDDKDKDKDKDNERGKDKNVEDVAEKTTRTTRHRSYSVSKVDTKPLKTLDKSATTQAENSTNKKAKTRNTKKNANDTANEEEEEEDFTSDDDLPLVEKKKSKLTPQEKPKRKLKRSLNRANQSAEAKSRDKSADRKSDASSSEPVSKRKPVSANKQKPKASKTALQNTANNKSLISDRSGNDTQGEENKPDVKVTKRKRRNEFTDLSQTDQSENETKTGRPMRKTKEAAAIYMELIGQKLYNDLLSDLSMDSFPELPNVKKTEQMENDMKANLGKEKRELTSTPKRGRPKREDCSSQPEERANTPQKPATATAAAAKGLNTQKVQKSEPQPKKLEKSFSDSDDEPLASKVDRKPKSPKKERKSAAAKVTTTAAATTTTTTAAAATTTTKTTDKTILVTTTTVPLTKTENKDSHQEQKSTDLKQGTSLACNSNDTKHSEVNVKNTSTGQANSSMVTPAKNTSTTTEPTIKTKNTSSPPKSIDLNETEFKMPAESVKQLLSPPINVSPIKMPSSMRGNLGKDKTTGLNKDLLASSSGKNSSQSISAILADLMPSKEESGKIFGIASVTLAQSSGPLDTKCTLGKCGSIHKPSLGPGVPTEVYLGDQMSNKDRRKAKVNMTHEQIEKWLSECSLTADPFVTDSLDDEIDLTSPPKPINYLSTPSPLREGDNFREELSLSSSSKLKTAQPATKDSKSTTVPAQQSVGAVGKSKVNLFSKGESTTKGTAADNKDEKSVVNQSKSIAKESTSAMDKTILMKKLTPATTTVAAAATTTPIATTSTPSQTKKSEGNDSKTEVNSKTITPIKTQSPSSKPNFSGVSITPDKKPIYNRRTPVYNTKKPDQNTVKSPPIVNTFGAFSPENEASVYSFDKEEDTMPASIPFRRHSRRGSTHSKNNENDTSIKKTNITPIGKVNKDQSMKKPSSVSLTMSQSDTGNKSGVIAAAAAAATKTSANDKVKKPLANDSSDLAKVTAISLDTDGKDSDSEGHTFYIPLQCMSGAGTASDQLIQGVEVKLGTEGPEGPNQKVIMHAKLVTKSQMSANTTPIPEGMGMANIQEIVKNLIANKEMAGSLKSLPIGTIPSRFKPNDPTKPSTSSQPTESIAATQQQQQSQNNAATNLTRHNSNQSLFSHKAKTTTKRMKNEQTIQPSNNTAFPRYDDPAQMVEAPVFRPTEKEFQDPIEFINRITPVAARFGLCRIIPPSTFKPECKISDDMRFTAYNQYVHKMLHRWGPNVKEFNAIKTYSATQSIKFNQPPLIGGMEVDLPRLYHTVQELEGLKEVIEKKKWARVAEEMCIPKLAQDRVAKLDDIYCKYLLPYDTLSASERQKLFDSVEADWAKSEAKARRNADRSALSDSNSNENSESDDQSDDDDDDESGDSGSMECIVKGKSMALSAFFRVARNTMALWFRNGEPTTSEVEAEFWRHVNVRDSHVCVHSGSIDSSGWGYGFPSPGPKTKNSTCSKHPWNLKVLTNNHNSILRSIGPITGVTVPTLHVGMLFSACCWYRDPHGLPWIEYLHTGGSKIWYSVPNEQSTNFRTAFTSMVPTYCQNKTVWLPCDTAMVPPHMLTERGVSLCRTEQEPGQFVVVFPRAYTSNICTSYSISESVYFAPMSWLETAKEDFKDIHDSCEPAMFSLEQLLFSVAQDIRTNVEILEVVLPMLKEVYDREMKARAEIQACGVNRTEKIVVKPKKPQTEENECDICRANVYISWIKCDDDSIYCLQHAVKYLKNERIQAKQCTLLFLYKKDEIEEIIRKVNEKLNQQKKKSENKK